MKIAIVVLNYNGKENTLVCINSIKKLNKSNYKVELIVVDNASNDGSSEALSKIKDIMLVKNDKNLGYSGGNNIGIKHALSLGSEYILILNNDTIVEKSLIINLINSAKKGDIVSPKIYFAKGFEFHKNRYKKEDLGKVIWYAGGKIDWQNVMGIHIGVDEVDHGQFSKRLEINLATGACILIRRQVFKKIGFFDEKYFLYLEDMDFCVRAKRAGFKIIFEPKAILWHKNASSGGGSGSGLQDYYISRNRLLFATKYAKARTKFAVFKQILSQINSPIKRKALIDFVTFNFGKGSFL